MAPVVNLDKAQVLLPNQKSKMMQTRHVLRNAKLKRNENRIKLVCQEWKMIPKSHQTTFYETKNELLKI